MLTITIPESELWDEKKQEFITVGECTILLEHSLESISKWESKWNKPFLSRENRTDEETIDYIKCMTLNPGIDENVYYNIPNDVINKIISYINSPSTATKISSNNGRNRGEIVTNEIIYYWMISLNIPFECEKWHLNHLLTLIRVCSIKNKPGKKMSNREILSQNAALNAARRKKLNTKG